VPSRLAKSDAIRCRAIASELEVVKLGGELALDIVLPELQTLLAVDAMLAYSPALLTNGWEFSRYHSVRFENGTKVKTVAAEFLAHAPFRYSWYDALHPEPSQRNVVIAPLDLFPRDEVQACAIYNQWLKPTGLHRHEQLRVLVCEGEEMLAWVGAFHSERFEPRQFRILAALVPSLRQRLDVERRLGCTADMRRSIAPLLDQLGAPAFVLGDSGRIYHANQSGLALLETQRSDVHISLQCARKGSPSALAFTIVPLTDRGMRKTWLATLSSSSTARQTTAAIVRAVQRWKLTKRQHQTLERIVDGYTNAMIAADFRITERAVELHVTNIFNRAGVDNRATLVSRVFLG